ncbi:MAG: tocopherol cyclase family protein [Chloroflexota bacterium]
MRATLDPDRYHGRGRGRPFFEGWYYKLVDRAEGRRYAIIPGVFRGQDAAADHAFIQVLDGVSGQTTYTSLPIGSFATASERFDVSIGPNRFTAGYLDLDLDGEGTTVRGRLELRGVTPWPVSLRSPGIMGWYAWVPFMECYHGVVSLDHALEGSLAIDGAAVDFGGGRGYTEKDWGSAFPAAYIWCQTNHFARPGTCLTASVAIIPWLRGSFPGFIVGLWHEGVLYRFATYTGARLERLVVGEEQIDWVVRDRRYRLEMTLTRASGSHIKAPTRLSMDRRIAETLNASARVRLLALGAGGESEVFAGEGRHAGLEAAGDLPRLLRLHHGRRGQQ